MSDLPTIDLQIEEKLKYHDYAVKYVKAMESQQDRLHALIRDLQQQLKTAREDALEEAAQVAERDVDWSAFGKAAIEPWEKGQDSLRDYRLGIVSGRAIAAAIRSIGEKATSPGSASDSAG